MFERKYTQWKLDFFCRCGKRTHGSKPMGPLIQTLLMISVRHYNCVISDFLKVQPILCQFSGKLFRGPLFNESESDAGWLSDIEAVTFPA